MKKIFIILFIFIGLKTFSQELNDHIYTKENDSILCKITSVKGDWIYYDHIKNKKIRNDYIHVDDIKSYVYKGKKIIPYEYKLWGRLDEVGSTPDNIPIEKNQIGLDTSLNEKEWHIGYLTFKNSKDTLFGWVKEDRWKGSRYEKIVFKKNIKDPYQTFIKDSLVSYKWGEFIHYIPQNRNHNSVEEFLEQMNQTPYFPPH